MSKASGMNQESPRPRSRFLAALFNLVAPGLGFLYLKRLRLALTWPIVMLAPFAIMAWSEQVFTVAGMWAVIILVPLLWFASIVSSAIIAHRHRQQTLARYQRVHFYMMFLLLSVGVNLLLTGSRGDIFGYESFRLPSGSMLPTFQPGDFINANVWHYRTHQPKRGELIVFRYPPDPRIDFVKRVIGLPGESVELKSGNIYINGELLHEPYVKPEHNQRKQIASATYEIPPRHYLVLGDNRDRSNDSRSWGFLPVENIRGRVEMIWFSINSDGIQLERIGTQLH